MNNNFEKETIILKNEQYNFLPVLVLPLIHIELNYKQHVCDHLKKMKSIK